MLTPRNDLFHMELQVLLVEDQLEDVVLLQEAIGSLQGDARFPLPPLRVTPAASLREAMEQLARGRFEAVLLDLNLPDSRGLETFASLTSRFSEPAVVVLTALHDEQMGVESIRLGAQDYLVKGEADGPLLVRSLRYAVERKRLQLELDRLGQRQRREEEIRSLEGFSAKEPGGFQRILSLKDVYGELVRHYVWAARERKPKPTEKVVQLALRLSAMEAEAKEVVRLHLNILRETGHWATPSEERAFSVDARLVLVELLGHLADTYRERGKGTGSVR